MGNGLAGSYQAPTEGQDTQLTLSQGSSPGMEPHFPLEPHFPPRTEQPVGEPKIPTRYQSKPFSMEKGVQ